MIGAVILAAGGSTRLGRPKQLEPCSGTSLLSRTVDAAEGASLRPIVVVLGAFASRVRSEIAQRDVQVVLNPNWERGMSESIRRGVAVVAAVPDVSAVVLLACDQARITADVVIRLCAAFDGRPRRRVASEYAGTLGVPALFERALFEDLGRLEGDRGARSVLTAEPGCLLRVPWPDGALDIDREEDLERGP
jgi:molybdenum cofactor cytidylyltransferase